mgnify:CR=1 FL=1
MQQYKEKLLVRIPLWETVFCSNHVGYEGQAREHSANSPPGGQHHTHGSLPVG